MFAVLAAPVSSDKEFTMLVFLSKEAADTSAYRAEYGGGYNFLNGWEVDEVRIVEVSQ